MIRTRDAALDAFRGVSVVGMVLVNLQGSEKASWPLLAHSRWDGVTVADLVFPFFLLASGLAAPLALDGRGGGLARPVRRAASLLLIGLALGWLLAPSLDLHALRVAGVLQRIAIVYLACAVVCVRSAGWRVPLGLAVALLAAHGALLFVPAPGETMASLAPGMGMAGWLDRTLLPGHLYRPTYDPEGLLSTLSAIAEGLIGVAVQRRIAGVADPVRVILAAALGCLAVAFVLLPWLPLNKSLWTPSFALFTAGLGLALWAGLRRLWPGVADRRGARALVVLGQVALTLYVAHMLLIAILVLPLGEGDVWEASFARVARTGLPGGVASLAYAVVASAAVVALTFALRRRGWLLRV